MHRSNDWNENENEMICTTSRNSVLTKKILVDCVFAFCNFSLIKGPVCLISTYNGVLLILPLVSSRSMASKTPVGFIGLGNMGSPMAKNLLKNGYPIIATDVFPESCKELQDMGAQVTLNLTCI